MRNFTCFLLLVLGLCGVILGQTDSNPDTYSESEPYKSTQESSSTSANKTVKKANTFNKISNEKDVINIDSTLVTIPVSVSNATNGLYVSNIKKEEFKIFENGVEQKIAYFGTFDEPFTVVLILDTSPSTEYKIEEIQTAAKFFVDQLKPQDRVEIIKFNRKIRVLARATRKRKKIYKAIEKARFGGGTSLYDVVDFVLQERLKKVKGRKAIVLFTDGVDTTSNDAFYDGTLQRAEKSDVSIFPVRYNTLPRLLKKKKFSNARGERLEDYKLAKMYLDDLAISTGGRVILPNSTSNGLNNAFKKIAEELSYQYSIGYYPLEEGKPGQRKKIKVRVYRPNLNVRARDNYVVKTP